MTLNPRAAQSIADHITTEDERRRDAQQVQRIYDAMGAADRLEKRIERFISREPNTGCWLWTGGVDLLGYGRIKMRHGLRQYRSEYAHRIVFAHYRGAIAQGLSLCHRCDTPACVNPDHLFLGTQADNMRDMWAKGRGLTPQMCRERNANYDQMDGIGQYGPTGAAFTPDTVDDRDSEALWAARIADGTATDGELDA